MEAILGERAQPRSNTHAFHFWMAAAFLLIAFGGFLPSYWAPVLHGTFRAPPIVHIHGILLFSWTLLYLVQTWLVAAGRTPAHRAWGLLGISLFSVMVCSIIAAKITLMNADEALGFGVAARRFAAVPLIALPVIVGLFVFAIANVRRPELHKRAMLVMMAGLMTPAVARVFLYFLAPPGAAANGPPPTWVAVPPAIVGILLVGIAMIYDWRTRGRPHTVYVVGILLLIVEPLLMVLISGTSTWMAIAARLEHVAG